MLQPFPLSILWVTKIQFTDSFANAVQGTSQPSFESQLPVFDMLWEKYGNTSQCLGESQCTYDSNNKNSNNKN